MRAEIDQSGKFDQTDKPTVLALANDIEFSVRVSAVEKRKCFQILRSQRSDKNRRTTLYVLLFATLVYLLLREHVHRLDSIVIDTEFSGHEGTIKTHLHNLFNRQGVLVPSTAISFRQIGKSSPAHDLAIRVFRGKQLPDREIDAREMREILREFRK